MIDMSSMDNPKVSGTKHHRRNRSAVLKSMMKRSDSDEKQAGPAPYSPHGGIGFPLLPPDHPHAMGRALSEISPQRNSPQPRRAYTEESQRPKALHKKTKSSVSLRSLGRSKESKSKEDLGSGTTAALKDRDCGLPTKKKSMTGLGGIFKNKSVKDEDHLVVSSNKENAIPRRDVQEKPFAPIYAAFATQIQEVSSTTKVPLNDQEYRRSVIEDIALYDPKIYDGSKQRNFGGYAAQSSNIVRPKSEVIANNELSRFLNPKSRKSSDEGRPQSYVDGHGAKERGQDDRRTKEQDLVQRQRAVQGVEDSKASRVKAAVERINRRTVRSKEDKPENLKKFQADFEAMLEARNIPELVRDRMRTLELHVKQEFLRAYEQDQSSARGHSSGSDGVSAVGSADTSHTSTQGNTIVAAIGEPENCNEERPDSKKTRPRSRTFTFKKGDKSNATTSPAKKQKTEAPVDAKRFSQPDITSPSLLSTSPGPANGSYFLGLKKSAAPNDYVNYLKKHRLPEQVEVGKLHKMRQLLRNETLPWVHQFIELGGMMELVNLLYRLMDIEWREERDDQLLNEALLCLKALCTTDLALQKLCEVEKELFPALLSMLFDKEHRGPSEFATRQIIVTVLLAHLEAATRVQEILPARAKTILSYLTDQENADKRNHLPFDLEVGPKRPYKFWNKEISNVTKEVFWVWLHPLNVIPYPRVEVQEESTGCLGLGEHPTVRKCPPPRDLAAEVYTREFFPRPRPPVPAAPYIGGVEWDATNYLASHVDLLNGLIASLPTREERNALRAELRASGIERTMGEKLRQCKEKYYGAVHDVLKTWIAAAICDGWDVKEVRMGPPKEELSPRKTSPKKSPAKKQDQAPQLDAPPKLNLDLGLEKIKADEPFGKGAVDDWL